MKVMRSHQGAPAERLLGHRHFPFILVHFCCLSLWLWLSWPPCSGYLDQTTTCGTDAGATQPMGGRPYTQPRGKTYTYHTTPDSSGGPALVTRYCLNQHISKAHSPYPHMWQPRPTRPTAWCGHNFQSKVAVFLACWFVFFLLLMCGSCSHVVAAWRAKQAQRRCRALHAHALHWLSGTACTGIVRPCMPTHGDHGIRHGHLDGCQS